MEKPELAIIIPAFKSTFFRECLWSISQQSVKHFRVYVCNDAGDSEIEVIVNEYSKIIPISYKYFENNLGRISLTKQWERCIFQSEDEPWIWLFSDDDIMPSDAVERFYSSLEQTPLMDVFRFPLAIINEKSEIIRVNKNLPRHISNFDALRKKLRGEISTAACEYIVRRSRIYSCGGYKEFPLAWCSDDASILSFANVTGMEIIGGAPVLWRNAANINISNSTLYDSQKLDAVEQFIIYLTYNYPELFEDNSFLIDLSIYTKTILYVSLGDRTSLINTIQFLLSIAKRITYKWGFRLGFHVIIRRLYTTTFKRSFIKNSSIILKVAIL